MKDSTYGHRTHLVNSELRSSQIKNKVKFLYIYITLLILCSIVLRMDGTSVQIQAKPFK